MVQLSEVSLFYRCWWWVLWSFCNIFHRKKKNRRQISCCPMLTYQLAVSCKSALSNLKTLPSICVGRMPLKSSDSGRHEITLRFFKYIVNEYTPPKFNMEPENDKRNHLCQGLLLKFHVKFQGCIYFNTFDIFVYRICYASRGCKPVAIHIRPGPRQRLLHLPRMHTTSHLDTQAFGAFQDILSGRDPVANNPSISLQMAWD